MIINKNGENRRDTTQEEAIHPRFAQMNNRLAIINDQISKQQDAVSAEPIKVPGIDEIKEALYKT